MPDGENDLIERLRDKRVGQPASIPATHWQRTDECPPVGRYGRLARTGWAEWAGHAGRCEFCQKSLAAEWKAECPGLDALRAYLSEGRNRRAMERHLEWDECASCAAKLRLLEATDRWKERLGAWLVFPAPSLAAAHAASREPIGFCETIDEPPLVIEVRQAGRRLGFEVRSEDSSMEGRRLEVRLTGRTREVRVEVVVGAMTEGPFAATDWLEVEEAMLEDLPGCLVSVWVGEMEE